MDKQRVILHELLELAYRLDVTVRKERLGDEELPAESGLAWIDGTPVLFLEARLSPAEPVAVLVRELSRFPIEDVYIKPGIRALLEPGVEDDAKAG